MRLSTRILLICILFSTLISCIDNRQKRKNIVAKRIEVLIKKQSEWDTLTKEILKDNYVNSHLGLFISPDDLDKQISIELKEKGIVRFSVTKGLNCPEVEYLTNWTEYPIGSLYLTWKPCDNLQTKKGYYKDNSNFIEVWGIGKGWLIWIDSDFI